MYRIIQNDPNDPISNNYIFEVCIVIDDTYINQKELSKFCLSLYNARDDFP